MNGSTPGEVDDRVEVPVGLRAAEAEDRRVEVDVLPAGEVGVEAGPELEQRGHPPARGDRAGRGLQDAADQLEQGALARAVRADEADGRPGLDLERDVLEGPEVLLVQVRAAEVDHPLLERLLLADDEPLGQVADLDDDGAAHHSSCAKLPCSRAKTRCPPQTARTPTTRAMTRLMPRSGGAGWLSPLTQKVCWKPEHGQGHRVGQVEPLEERRCGGALATSCQE